MAIYTYSRVSTGRQAEEGESLGAQQRRAEGYALMQGFTIDAHFVERGVSGSVPIGGRPEGGRLLTMLRRGDMVITPKLDRMFRSALDALNTMGELRDRGVSLHMIDLGGDVTSNGIAKLVFTILAAVAEAERDRTRERIADVKHDQRKRGRYLGGTVPFGFALRNDGSLAEVEGEQEAVCEMAKLQAAGKSLRVIAAAMGKRGFQMSHNRVRDILSGTEAAEVKR
ncbi:recombinase family protein [Methylobacterium sp. J-001]|uniref:recombinase family protein n=1 Tax=Methylobacterium sp. J-001 TaxID=2836609 RepID=UPI001FBBA947|nr:recombinase family protein [Methylobacterium sp. J-001]MCJ2116735.1 recombinase family protein [Methylobacterium sp. J-001]